MDINHENKNLGEPIDINNAVNDLVEKTITIVESPENVTSKQINDVKTALENLKGVDKTLNYELFPEIREKLKKIRNETPELDYQNKPSINKPEKEENEIEETRNEAEKNTKEVEEPTESQRKEYNEIINEKLDRTIKTLEEIEEATNTEGKNEQEIEASRILSGKIAKRVVLEFLNNGVKKLAQVEAPEEKVEKTSNEMDLNPGDSFKTEQPVEDSSLANRRNKTQNEIERDNIADTSKTAQEVNVYNTESTEKSLNDVDEDLSFTTKEAPEVGGLVDLINSEINSTIRANNTEIDESAEVENKEVNNTPDTDITTGKNESIIDDYTVYEEKIPRQIYQETENTFKESKEVKTPRQVGDKENNEIVVAKEDGKTENEVTTTLEKGKTKTEFEVDTTINSKNKETVEETEQKTSKQRNTLEDHGARAEIDSQTQRKRSNTGTQQQEDYIIDNYVYKNDSGSASIQGAKKKKSGTSDSEENGTQLYGQYNTVNEFGLNETVEYDATTSSSKENRKNKTFRSPAIEKADLKEEKPRGGTPLGDAEFSKINRVGKEDIIGSLLNTYLLFNLAEVRREAIKDVRRFNTKEGARQLSQDLLYLETRNAKYKSLDDEETSRGHGPANRPIPVEFASLHRREALKDDNPEDRRSFKHKSHPRNTGYLRIYTRRSTDIEGTLLNEEHATTKMIPFQFEPGYSGDSKKAEYSSIGTLGRSGSAKVYTKSQERSIQLTLDYVVTGPRIGESPNPEETNHSNSSTGMGEWSEDYIYNFIVPNLRNLVKPNVGQEGGSRKFRLGPPIIQVWYGGLDNNGGSSTGQWNAQDGSRDEFKNIPPIFLTTWMVEGMDMITYRSLWLPQSVDLEYSGGIVNYKSRNKVRVTAEISLVEIGPSITANEILNWWKRPARQ